MLALMLSDWGRKSIAQTREQHKICLKANEIENFFHYQAEKSLSNYYVDRMWLRELVWYELFVCVEKISAFIYLLCKVKVILK